MFAVHYLPEGTVDYIGEVFSETNGMVRIQVIDVLLLNLLGGWYLTDRIVEVDKKDCRIFLSESAAVEACGAANRHDRYAP